MKGIPMGGVVQMIDHELECIHMLNCSVNYGKLVAACDARKDGWPEGW